MNYKILKTDHNFTVQLGLIENKIIIYHNYKNGFYTNEKETHKFIRNISDINDALVFYERLNEKIQITEPKATLIYSNSKYEDIKTLEELKCAL